MNLKATIGSEHYNEIFSTLGEMVNDGLLEQKPDKHYTMFFLTEKGYNEMVRDQEQT